MAQSIRYRISAAFKAALEFEFALEARVKRNPAQPSASRDGARVVLLIDDRDSLLEQSGQLPKRVFQFRLGALARGGDDEAEAVADADYVRGAAAVRAACPALAEDLGSDGVSLGTLREREQTFALEDIDTGDGALVLGAFEIEYRKPARPRA